MTWRVWSLTAAAVACLAGPASAAPGGRFADPAYHCDGRLAPPPVTTAVTEAVISGMTLGVLGLLVPFGDFNPHADPGALGIAACDTAIAQATSDSRRAEFTLARAVHRLEIKDYEAALADARSAPAAAGPAAAEPGFRRSLGVAGLNIEAVALVGLGRIDAARETALRMAAFAPFDVEVANRAVPILMLADGSTPAERDFFERARRLDYRLLNYEEAILARAGEFGAVAEDVLMQRDHIAAFDPKLADSPVRMAGLALLHALQGDMARSQIEALEAAAGASPALGAPVGRDQAEVIDEFLATTEVVRLNAEGHGAEARAALLARRSWRKMPRVEVAAVLDRLMAGAPEADRRGLLAIDPAKLRAEDRTALMDYTFGPDGLRRLLGGLAYEPPAAYEPVAARIWTVDRSPLEVNAKREVYRRGGGEIRGSVYSLPNYRFDLGRQALLLHCALVAKARGSRGFVLGPVGQTNGAMLWVQYGDPGADGFPKATALVADDVIAGLSDRAPKPPATAVAAAP